MVLRANRKGELRFTLENQRVTVGTYFKNLETPSFNDNKESKLHALNYFTLQLYDLNSLLCLKSTTNYSISIYWLILDEAESEDDDSIVQGKKIKLAGNVPAAECGVKGNKRKSTDLFCDVRVDLKKLLLYLSADQIIPKRTLANFVEGKLIHLFMIHDNICVQYLLPALVD